YEGEFFRYIGSLYKLIHPADLPGMQAALNKHIQGRAFFYEAEYRIRHKLGDWIYTLARGKIIEWDTQGKPLRLCGINIDISKRKKLEAELQALAMTDVLTGIYNRRYFTQLLEKEMKRSQRYQTSFSLVMFDIDHFKQVNDTYGHDVGDLVLKEVVSLIKTRIRKTDFFARWGGEEFIILLLNTSYEQAAILAESMRELLQNTSLPQVGRVTASFGVSSYQANESIDALLKRVDDLVYQAKRNGRNCVRVDRY
ncbi:MAG: sensor domain-containing diguanylate cyclase, partial [Syntrophomonadaceae bacterium]|nr:sensor domain-containing diguanylate cyclase [Syntrophomonadaceae bacterium]